MDHRMKRVGMLEKAEQFKATAMSDTKEEGQPFALFRLDNLVIASGSCSHQGPR